MLVVFEEYLTPNQDAVRGTITFLFGNARVARPFIVVVNTREVAINAATGNIDNSGIGSIDNPDLFYHTFGLNASNPSISFHHLIQNQTSIAI